MYISYIARAILAIALAHPIAAASEVTSPAAANIECAKLLESVRTDPPPTSHVRILQSRNETARQSGMSVAKSSSSNAFDEAVSQLLEQCSLVGELPSPTPSRSRQFLVQVPAHYLPKDSASPRTGKCGPTPEDYPIEARRLRIEGNVKVALVVSPGGHIALAYELAPSADERLVSATLNLLARCRIESVEEHAFTTVEYRWKLQ
jgi:hypothetical protein